MVSIPVIESYLRDTVTIEVPSGITAYGRESYAASTTSKARVEPSEVWVRSNQGFTKVQGARIFLPATCTVAVGAKITTTEQGVMICHKLDREVGFSLNHYVATCGPL